MTHDNRLALEKSPYLLQHRHNPVDWYPWGEEAFNAARAQGKPIFLSVGYATCHWCHVMERESFEDDEVAALLNRSFISIKVDREELPDVDQIYMNAVHAMGMRGGWPMSIVMTPDLKPFFGGTYFPRPNFMHLLLELNRVWTDERHKIDEVSENLVRHLTSNASYVGGDVALSDALFSKAFAYDLTQFDATWGGFSPAPKFPPSMQLRLLLRIHRRTGSEKALEMVTTTLDRMARGGMYDHLGGGFARYSTDAQWLVPHFEKMLYDNAQLSLAYLEAFQATGTPMFAEVARETLDYVLRDMTSPEGGFYSAEDADSEGVEGKFYVWTLEELATHLTAEELELFNRVYGVTRGGNFEHANVLNLQKDFSWAIKADPRLQSAHQKLKAVRDARIHPLKDDKQLSSWNGLMIAAMAKGYQVLRDSRYLEAARRSAQFLQSRLYSDGTLHRRYRDGEVRYAGTLEDYAFVIQGLLTLYEADFQARWVTWALDLQRIQDARFWDEAQGGYFYTPTDAADLLVRTREFTDGALPNPNAIAALSLMQLSALTLEPALKAKAERVFQAAGKPLEQYPGAFAQLLIAIDFYLDDTKEVALIGRLEAEETRKMLETLQGVFAPNKVLALAGPEDTERLPLLEHRPLLQERTTVYVCEDAACRRPTHDIAEVLALVQERRTYALTGVPAMP